MAVKIDNQHSLLGNPFVWLFVLSAGVGGIYYYRLTHRVEEAPPPVVAEVPKPPEPPKQPDWVDLPPPPADEPKTPVVKADDITLAHHGADELPRDPDDPLLPYELEKGAKVVTPKLGKGPDALDKEMWAFDATPDKPFKWGKEGGKDWLPKIQKYLAKDAKHTVAHPCAKDFPGAVPADAPRLEKVVKIPLNTHRWVSTGMYAPPGEIIRIQVGSELKGRCSVIIGCHRDNIAASKREATHRFPIISTGHAVDKSTIEVSNPFGGLIYIDVPFDKSKLKSKSTCRVEITGAVEAPLFVLGETTKDDWIRLRVAPAPWGEIGGKSHFAAARSNKFREMPYDTAKKLAEYWDKVVDLQDWLCGWDPRTAPERMVPDAEISAGSGHSGYPYMGYLDWESWTDLQAITTGGSWGHYHEVGHNHQSGAWTFAGYGEVTNNVMGLLCEDKMANIKPGSGGGWLGDLDEALAARLGPPPREDARGNLAMYVPVINAFGWESLRNTWSEYAKKSGRSSMNLSSDDKKKETFVRIWSKHCKANLGPYFESFGFPYTPAMKSNLGGLKKWMPPKLPPKVDPAKIGAPVTI